MISADAANIEHANLHMLRPCPDCASCYDSMEVSGAYLPAIYCIAYKVWTDSWDWFLLLITDCVVELPCFVPQDAFGAEA